VKLRALLWTASVVAVGTIGVGVAGGSSAPTEYITITAASATGTQTVVAVGPISAVGTSDHTKLLTFPDGTLSVHPSVLTQSTTGDARTCAGTITETGVYTITGRGAYAGASGSGRFKLSVIATQCDPKKPPTVVSSIFQLNGPLTWP
jgi:hypothetical protein